MNSTLKFSIALTVLAVVAAVLGYSGPDLPPGPYCGAKPNSCCRGREDRCSAPILDTLCYCDDFCNRTVNDDCCPDFWSFCHGFVEPTEPPQQTRSCFFRGREYRLNQKSTDNCNQCVCQQIGNAIDMVCETDHCMIEQELIEQVNRDGSMTWRAGNHTPFWGHKLSEGIKLRLGTLDPKKSTVGLLPLHPVYDPKSMPRAFNAIENWDGQLSKIRDQGWCGSSWAITTTDTASDKFFVMSNGLETPLLSPQQLLSCNSRGQQSCHGGYLDIAWQYSFKHGLVNEECFPYKGIEHVKCTIPLRKKSLVASGCTPPSSPTKRVNRYHVSPPHRLGNETDIMYDIITSGPVQATMKVYKDFFSYESGVYKKSRFVPSQPSGYHSVRIVGWGEENGTKYWLAANSWGENWGENGYFKIARGVNECEVESFVIGVWANTVDNKAGVEG